MAAKVYIFPDDYALYRGSQKQDTKGIVIPISSQLERKLEDIPVRLEGATKFKDNKRADQLGNDQERYEKALNWNKREIAPRISLVPSCTH